MSFLIRAAITIQFILFVPLFAAEPARPPSPHRQLITPVIVFSCTALLAVGFHFYDRKNVEANQRTNPLPQNTEQPVTVKETSVDKTQLIIQIAQNMKAEMYSADDLLLEYVRTMGNKLSDEEIHSLAEAAQDPSVAKIILGK